MAIKVCSLNCNGLRTTLKFLSTFLYKNKIGVLFVQETHRHCNKTFHAWAEKYHFQVFRNFPAVDEDSKYFKSGTCILINNNLLKTYSAQHKVIYQNRLHCISLQIHDITIDIYNIYLPSGTSAKASRLRGNLLEILERHLHNSTNNNKIIGGDFNFVIDDLDTYNRKQTRVDKQTLLGMLNTFHLIDTFRHFFPTVRTYSYIRSNSASRIDRIYASFQRDVIVQTAVYLPIRHFSDHSFASTFSFILPSQTSSTSHWWKLNSSILEDQNTADQIKDLILYWNDKKHHSYSILTWWDSFKLALKHKFLALTSQLKKKINGQIEETLAQLQQLNENCAHTSEIIEAENELQHLYKYQYAGAATRARHTLLPEDEIPNKAFFQLETKHADKLCIKTLTKEDGTVISDPNEIKTLTATYFSQFWDRSTPLQEDQLQQYLADIPQIEDSLSENTPPFICFDEIVLAIDQLKISKSPGGDGLTAEFYKTFKRTISYQLQDVFNNVYLRRCLSTSQSEAYVRLIPKKGDHTKLSNWRPISLLNCDYKILSSIIYNRLCPLLTGYINESQQCGLPSRSIINTLMNTTAALEHQELFQAPFALLHIDFSKAFDSVSHSFMFAVLQHIGIPSHLVNWIKILYDNTSSRIQTSHGLTDPIQINSGVRQGDPLSMLLFVVITDILSKKVEANQDIHGIKLGKKHLTIQQYADDTFFFLTDDHSAKELKSIITSFSNMSGLCLNEQKTKIFCQSQHLKNMLRSLFPENQFTENISILGFLFGSSIVNQQENWKKIIIKLKNISNLHKHRQVSMLGKVLLLNALFVPHILTLARFSLPNSKHIRQIQKIFYSFLWHPQPFEPVKRSHLTADKSNGGINFPDPMLKNYTSFVMPFKSLFSGVHSNHFWYDWMLFNLGTKVLTIRKTSYSNSAPHGEKPNNHWMTALKMYENHQLKQIDWTTITFKTLYNYFRDRQNCGVDTTKFQG